MLSEESSQSSREEYNERLLNHFWNGKNLPSKYKAQKEEIQIWSKRIEPEDAYEMSKHNGKSCFQAGLDHNRGKTNNYKDSLPPFIKAASDGNLGILSKWSMEQRLSAGLKILVATNHQQFGAKWGRRKIQ